MDVDQEIIKWDERGLVPAIVQDQQTGEVLMMAYMNRQSLDLSMSTGETHFWSRSRQELWHKGATSGNTQHILEIRYDCDADTLLVLVRSHGPACHTGQRSCFYRSLWRSNRDIEG
jgi:phosphoribosyl-AMP cyclohydrolase